jgi:hypothetical protein
LLLADPGLRGGSGRRQHVSFTPFGVNEQRCYANGAKPSQQHAEEIDRVKKHAKALLIM